MWCHNTVGSMIDEAALHPHPGALDADELKPNTALVQMLQLTLMKYLACALVARVIRISGKGLSTMLPK